MLCLIPCSHACSWMTWLQLSSVICNSLPASRYTDLNTSAKTSFTFGSAATFMLQETSEFCSFYGWHNGCLMMTTAILTVGMLKEYYCLFILRLLNTSEPVRSLEWVYKSERTVRQIKAVLSYHRDRFLVSNFKYNARVWWNCGFIITEISWSYKFVFTFQGRHLYFGIN